MSTRAAALSPNERDDAAKARSIAYRGEQAAVRVEFLDPRELIVRDIDVAIRAHHRTRHG